MYFLTDYIAKEDMDLQLPTLEPESEDTIFDYVVDESGKWVHWSEKVSGSYHLLDKQIQ